MFNNYDNSGYRAIMRNEQRKVKANFGLCCYPNISDISDMPNDNNIELLNRILIDNGNCGCGNRKSGLNEVRTNFYRFANQNFLNNAMGYSNVPVPDRVEDTPNNLNNSNNSIRFDDVDEIERYDRCNIFDRDLQIENILRRYCRNCRYCRRRFR